MTVLVAMLMAVLVAMIVTVLVAMHVAVLVVMLVVELVAVIVSILNAEHMNEIRFFLTVQSSSTALINLQDGNLVRFEVLLRHRHLANFYRTMIVLELVMGRGKALGSLKPRRLPRNRRVQNKLSVRSCVRPVATAKIARATLQT